MITLHYYYTTKNLKSPAISRVSLEFRYGIIALSLNYSINQIRDIILKILSTYKLILKDLKYLQ